MVKIQFGAYSTLYGYSHLWLIRQLTLPNLRYPNFEATKNPFVLEYIPVLNRLILYDVYGVSLSRFKVQLGWLLGLVRQLVVLVHLTILLEMIFLSWANNKKLLERYGEINENELSYKVARYLPTVYVSTDRCVSHGK